MTTDRKPSSDASLTRNGGRGNDVAYQTIPKPSERDLFERQQEALKVSEVRYRRLFEAARDGILILDANTSQITDSNPFMTELLGYAHEELLGKELADIGLFKDKDEAHMAMAQLQRDSFIRYDDKPLKTKSGERRDVEFVSNVYVEDGRNVIQCNIRDITERKHATEAVAYHQAETVTLNDRLRRAMTETHHRVKNSLQIIVAMIDMQTMDNPVFVPTSAVKRLGSQVAALAAVHDLLTEESKKDATAKSLNVRDLLETLIPLVSAASATKRVFFKGMNARISLNLATSLCLVANELITNAIKHGRDRVDITFHTDDQDAVLIVADNGPGFPDGFSPETMSNNGLEIVCHLVRLDLSGTIAFETEAGGGGRVTVKVPQFAKALIEETGAAFTVF